MTSRVDDIEEQQQELPAQPTEGEGGGAAWPGLSTVSTAYDRGNKGYLDETEKKLREMDSQNLGHLSTAKVYKLMQDLSSEKQKAVNLRILSSALAVFALLLCVANIGTSFAAAKLAKSVEVDNNNILVSTSDGRIVGVTGVSHIFSDLEPVYDADQSGRALQEDSDVSVQGYPGNFRMRESDVNSLLRDLCSGWGSLRLLADGEGGTTNFDCPHGQSSVILKACGIETQVSLQRNPRANEMGNKVFVNLYGCNGGTCDNDVRITCDLEKELDYNCNVYGLNCQVLCNKCAVNMPNDQRSVSWRCASNEQCGCAPNTCENETVEFVCPLVCFDGGAATTM